MNDIKIKEHTITLRSLPRSFCGYRILQISDIHLGRGNPGEGILQAVSALRVDMAALTGDIIHHPKHFPLIRPFLVKLLDALHATDGVFSVWGNHDKTVSEKEVEGLPIRWLHNDSIQLRRGTDAVNLAGVNQKVYPGTDLFRALGRAVPGIPTILLAHYPSTVYWFNGIIDLVLAGHTHAGQVKIPGLPFATNDHISWRHGQGLSTIGKTQLVVSAGVGMSGPFPFRVCAPAEMTLITLI